MNEYGIRPTNIFSMKILNGSVVPKGKLCAGWTIFILYLVFDGLNKNTRKIQILDKTKHIQCMRENKVYHRNY
jgi:hypothetical protein